MRSHNEDGSQSPLEPVDLSRRKVVKVALAASAVAVPVISSVALGGVSPAFAETPNISGRTTTAGTTGAPSSTTVGPTEAPGTDAPATSGPVATTTTTEGPGSTTPTEPTDPPPTVTPTPTSSPVIPTLPPAD